MAGLRAVGDKPVERIVDKMPDNYLYLGLLAALFPQAIFIHCRRDLRDVAVSCWMTDFRSIRWANDPEHIAVAFSAVPSADAALADGVAGADTRGRLRTTDRRLRDRSPAFTASVRSGMGASLPRFHQTARPVRTASVTQVRQPIYRQSLARWKNYEVPLADVFALLPVA